MTTDKRPSEALARDAIDTATEAVSLARAALHGNGHLALAALSRTTAAHLRRQHGLDPSLADEDDRHGMIADHAHLHGATVLPSGNLDWPADTVIVHPAGHLGGVS